MPANPTLIGIGTATQKVTDPATGLDAFGLMGAALRDAIGDAGTSPDALHADEILVPQGTWSFADPGRAVAETASLDVGSSVRVELGVLQTAIVHRACRSIAEGEAQCVVVVGGEAKHRELQRSIAGIESSEPDSPYATAAPDEHWQPAELVISRPEIDAGLVQAVSQYALVENATRAHDGIGIAEHRARIAALWSRFNAVARTAEGAWNTDPMTENDIDRPGRGNRPLAFPYSKWHNSQWNVDQAAALIFVSDSFADELGVDAECRLYPLAGADSDAVIPVTERTDMHRFVAAERVFSALEDRLETPMAALQAIELYSCFPIAVQLQARALGLPDDATPTITGGMSFAGGPFNNFVLQSVAAAGRAVREGRGPAMVSAVSGLLTKCGATVIGAERSAPFVHIDCTEPTVATTGRRPIAERTPESATIASYTVHYDDLEPSEAVLVCDDRQGHRVIAFGGQGLARRGVAEELIGRSVMLTEGDTRISGELV